MTTPCIRGLLIWIGLSGCALAEPPTEVPPEARPTAPTKQRAEAVFAAGCFWCVEEAFEKVDGVTEAISGFIGGHVASPSYKQVVSGVTGHTEAVRVVYDPRQVTYGELLEVFWRNVDPFDGDGQFCDQGMSYRPGIFVATREQKQQAEASKQQLDQRFPQPVQVEITEWTAFWPAETYHQDYYKKNPLRYSYYKWGCGRQARLDAIWGASPSADDTPPAEDAPPAEE